MILVTGATGTVGSEVVKQALAAGQRVRAWIHSPAKAAAFKAQGAEVALGDFTRPNTYTEALIGVDTLFLLSPMSPELGKLEAAFIGAAKQAGVRRVVLLSTAGADMEPGVTLGRLHREGEKAVEASGMTWTILRPNAFMTNLFMFQGSIRGDGKVYLPSGDGKFAFIDPRDIAEVAVKALTQPGHDNQALYLTGPEALSYPQVCQKLAAATGREINFVNIPDDAAKAGMLKQGLPEWLAVAMVEFFGPVARSGGAAYVSDTVNKVLGRAPRTFDAWCRERGAAFRS